jgi:hypothetical protein
MSPERVEQVTEKSVGHRHAHLAPVQVERRPDAGLARRSFDLAPARASVAPPVSGGGFG